jgi:hypothetical protein
MLCEPVELDGDPGVHVREVEAPSGTAVLSRRLRKFCGSYEVKKSALEGAFGHAALAIVDEKPQTADARALGQASYIDVSLQTVQRDESREKGPIQGVLENPSGDNARDVDERPRWASYRNPRDPSHVFVP